MIAVNTNVVVRQAVRVPITRPEGCQNREVIAPKGIDAALNFDRVNPSDASWIRTLKPCWI